MQHIKHEAKRRANEVLRRGKRELVAKGGVLPLGAPAMPGLRAVGTIAYASIYSQVCEERERPFYVERRISRAVRDDTGESHQWVSCSERFKSLELARNFVACDRELYRVMVLRNGQYVPDCPERPKGKGVRGFW
jgi:hypothetical protein